MIVEALDLSIDSAPKIIFDPFDLRNIVSLLYAKLANLFFVSKLGVNLSLE